MRRTIIGSDYIFDGTDKKVLEINTNTKKFHPDTTIYRCSSHSLR